MKQPIFVNISLLVIVFCLNACANEQIEIKNSLANSGSKIQISKNKSILSKSQKVIIYDWSEDAVGLNKTLVDLIHKTGNIKKDVIHTFLESNHFLTKDNQVSLLRIEEIGNATTFFLSSINDLEYQTNLPLFKKALELTLMRHLNTQDFTIIYDEMTAQL